jgi:hypothetical protein
MPRQVTLKFHGNENQGWVYFCKILLNKRFKVYYPESTSIDAKYVTRVEGERIVGQSQRSVKPTEEVLQAIFPSFQTDHTRVSQ